MSALDPLAAVVAGNPDLQALVDAELALLASDAQALRSLLVEDAVVTARVLPSNGLTDLLEIAGRRVAASLPPTVRPGDVLQVRVSGFDGERILLQIVGTGADAAVEPSPPLAPQPGLFVPSSIQPAPGTAPPAAASPTPSGPVSASPLVPGAPASGTPVAPGLPAGGSPVAPGLPAAGSAVASGSPTAGSPLASGLPAGGSAIAPGSPAGRSPVASAPSAGLPSGSTIAANLPPPAAAPVRGGLAPEFTSAVLRANVAASPAVEVAAGARGLSAAAEAAAAAVRATLAPGEPTSIETRVAAARAAVAQRVADEVPSSVAPSPARFVAPPPIAPKTLVPNAEAAARRAGAYPASAPSPAASTPARGAGLSSYAEPVALLRALRLPVTPSNVASAALALERPERLPAALAALERALPRASADPNVATLRTLLAFVGRIDPRSPALAAQIAAYVDHVVDGAEPKLATLLAATRAAAPPADPAAHPGAPPDPPLPLPAALAAERGAALSADLKQTLLAVAAEPATPAPVAPSLAGALTALTAVQINAAQTLAAHPDGLAFTIPLVTPHGLSNAHVSVKRDAPDGRGARLDPQNFRIAFVLETAHYGTVAIDLVTVGREVTVDVRTEAAPAMRAFRDALGTLTARLESLRYRVAAAGASVGTTSTFAVEAPPAPPADPNATVDRSA